MPMHNGARIKLGRNREVQRGEEGYRLYKLEKFSTSKPTEG